MTGPRPSRIYLAWIRLVAAVTSWGGFTHAVVHNGPLWWLCAGCRVLRRGDAS